MNEKQNRTPSKHDRLLNELSRMAGEALFDSAGHSVSAARFRALHYLIGLPSIVLAAAAGGTFLIEASPGWVTPLCAFLASALSAISTFLKPDQVAVQHYASARKFADIQREIRQLVVIAGVEEEGNTSLLVERMKAITSEISQAQNQARAIPTFAKRAHPRGGRREALPPLATWAGPEGGNLAG